MTGRPYPDHLVVAALCLAGTAFYLLPWAPAYLLALVVLAALSWYRLDLALILVVLFAPFFMLPKHIGGKEFAPSEIFIVLDVILAGAYVLHPARRALLDWPRLLRSPFLLPALLFLLAAALSTAFAADHHQALQAFRERILEPVAFFALLTLLVTRSSHWQWLFTALIAAGVIVGGVGLVQRATNQNLTIDAGIKKIHSVYGSPDNVGLLLDRAIPVWLSLGLAGRLRRILWLPWLGAGVILLSALILTYSRGAWVAIAVAAVGLFAVLRHWGRWFALAGILALAGAIILEGPSLQRAFSSGHAGTVHQRFYIWHSAVRMIQDHPILGIGPDNFLHYYAPRPAPHQYFQRFCPNGLGYIEPEAGAEPCLSHPHNAILDAWLSTGIVGLAAFIWLEVVFWSALWRAYRSSPELPGLILGTGAAMLASLIHGMVDNLYFLPDLAILFWLLCGFVSYLATARVDDPQAPTGVSRRQTLDAYRSGRTDPSHPPDVRYGHVSPWQPPGRGRPEWRPASRPITAASRLQTASVGRLLRHRLSGAEAYAPTTMSGAVCTHIDSLRTAGDGAAGLQDCADRIRSTSRHKVGRGDQCGNVGNSNGRRAATRGGPYRTISGRSRLPVPAPPKPYTPRLSPS